MCWWGESEPDFPAARYITDCMGDGSIGSRFVQSRSFMLALGGSLYTMLLQFLFASESYKEVQPTGENKYTVGKWQS